MGLDLGPPFRTDFVGVPPHVSTEDFVLWERFRRTYAKEYVQFYFDVAIGEGAEAPPGTPEKIAAAWTRLTRFRLDVLGDHGDEWHVIEMRPRAGPGAVGALQTYHTLLLGNLPDDRPLHSILVTDVCTRDIEAVAGAAGIRIICLSE